MHTFCAKGHVAREFPEQDWNIHASVALHHSCLCSKLRHALQQVESEVKEVNHQFARLRGMPNAAHTLDLYGRSFSMAPVQKASRPNTRVRRSGRTSQGPRLKSALRPLTFAGFATQHSHHLRQTLRPTAAATAVHLFP